MAPTPSRGRCASAPLRLAAREAAGARGAPPAAEYAPPRDWSVTSAVLKLHRCVRVRVQVIAPAAPALRKP